MKAPVFIFLSPHLDDAVLSCGGYIKHLTSLRQNVVVATVVTADPPSSLPLSWLARRNHRSWGLENSLFSVRCKEDEDALRVLGADPIHLGLIDAIYRVDSQMNPLYTRTTVGVPVHLLDLELNLASVTKKLHLLQERFSDNDLYIACPLGLGGHVDHLILKSAARSVLPEDHIFYYEDYPYAGRAGEVERFLTTMDDLTGWLRVTIKLTENEIEARIAAVACYTSQIRGLFPSNLERLQEIIAARVPFFLIAPVSPNNVVSSKNRMSTAVKEYVSVAGGEHYWVCGESNGIRHILEHLD